MNNDSRSFKESEAGQARLMATLIGRECWHVGATLVHGKIEKHEVTRING